MAATSVNGVNKTLYDAKSIVGEGIIHGKVQVKEFEYEASALDIASDISIATPFIAGDRILDIVLFNDALGASSELILGDSNDDNRYMTTIDSSTAGATRINAITGVNYAVGTNSGDEQLLITTAGAAITGTIKGMILYTNT